ncbi:MAG: PIN domain-containing protein, partial [Alphaproteobacteria bacterium]|nr:PIN domain-containing protein [Alphaproteobacteria bacterium]
MITYKFFDTCSLLLQANHLFEDDNENEKIVLSSITLQELEDIKTSNNKDAEIKYAARQLTRTLDECTGAYEVVIFTEDML